MNSQQKPSFFSALFDFSFSDFVTPQIIGVIYFLLMVLVGIYSVIMLFTISAVAPGGFLLGLPAAALMFIVSLVLGRMGLEVAVALFRIAQNSTRIARNSEAERHQG